MDSFSVPTVLVHTVPSQEPAVWSIRGKIKTKIVAKFGCRIVYHDLNTKKKKKPRVLGRRRKKLEYGVVHYIGTCTCLRAL